MYFFKQHKLNRLYKKQTKLKTKLASSSNKAEKTVLEAKLKKVESEIRELDFDIRFKN